MRVAVTGAAGRLGAALITRLQTRRAGEPAWIPLSWTRPHFDLDDLQSGQRLVERDRPDLVIHAAAWTDVDGCAREPGLALHRNGAGTAAIARACRDFDAALVVVSTNEVFDGERRDGRGYLPDDPTGPINAYGRSKLEGEREAQEAFSARGSALLVVRTSWLFGIGKPDFPAKIEVAARAASAHGRPLRLVADEIGSPTYVPDLADSIIRMLLASSAGVHHIVNSGHASRADWARDVLRRLEIDIPTVDVSVADFPRPSTPPRWGVLAATPLPQGPLRSWREAMADRMNPAGAV